VFDVAQLPGGRGSRAHIYNEFAVRHEQGTLEEPGGDLEVYGGFAAARDPRQASFVRAGFDASFHLPVISPGHLAAVRLVANMAEEVTPGAEKLAFYDYPRHPTFRGISTRYLLRSDRLVLVPSLNFHRQLSDRFTVRLFTDGLAVAPALADLRPANGLWAVGTEIVYHNDYADLAGLLFAYGPEGVRLSMFLGSSSTRNERTHWR
jgi:hypothetical protein